jgi:hypothetical protein
MRLRLKRWLYLAHRWLGLGMCMLFTAWFATGVIMMYVEYPELTEQERLAALPSLDAARVRVPVEVAAAAAGVGPDFASVALTTVMGRPAYRLRAATGPPAVVFADDGARLERVRPDDAVAAVRNSGFAPAAAAIRYEGARDFDQWTVSNALDEHRPLHRVAVDDEAGTVVYVSSATGEIVRDTARTERFWNWLGSTVHWVYPHQLRRHDSFWAALLTYLSLAGCISVATGAVIGWLRLRVRRRYRNHAVTPYAGVAKWHHLLGLASLVFVSTFIFSGLMSMSPWGWFDSAQSEALQVRRFAGGPTTATALARAPLASGVLAGAATKEVEWRQLAGEVYLVASASADDRRLAFADAGGDESLSALERRIRAAAPALVPHAPLLDAALLHEPDDYYYARHGRYRPLPAWRLKFGDEEATWFYVDARTGAVTLKATAAARVLRWLYNGLHSLDFAFLLRAGAVWDALVILLCAGGAVFAATSVVVAWRRLRRNVLAR